MADSKSMIVPATQEPTFWNRDAVVGFVIGNIPGMIIGGLIGKSRMKDEQMTGKVVSEPSFWNKSIFSGLLVGGLIATAVVLGTLYGFPLVTGVALTEATFKSMVLPLNGAVLGIELIGGIMGGLSGKERLTKEYNEAKAYVAEHGNYAPGQEKAPKISRATQVTPEEAQALYAKLSPKQKSFVDAEMARDQQTAVAAR